VSLLDPQAVYALWLRDVKRFVRTPSQVAGTLVFPLMFLVFLGTGFSDAALPGIPAGVEYIQYLVPGIVGFTMLFGASFAGLAILGAQDTGFLKEILVAPVSRTSIVLGWIAGGATTALIQGSLVFLIAIPLGFRVANPLLLPVVAVVLLLLAVTFVGFGVALASQFSDTQGFGLLIQFIVFPIFFLSGALFPLSELPAVAQYLGRVNPLTYGVDALRGALVGASTYPLALDVLALGVSAAVMVAVGAWLFGRVESV
jgi:ABC-2 type transport system permease protein